MKLLPWKNTKDRLERTNVKDTVVSSIFIIKDYGWHYIIIWSEHNLEDCLDNFNKHGNYFGESNKESLSFKSLDNKTEVSVFSDIAETMEEAMLFADIKLFELGYDLELPFCLKNSNSILE